MIKQDIVQPTAFAWQIDPHHYFRFVNDKQIIVDAAKPICDWLFPVDKPAREQLNRMGTFKWIDFTVDALGRLRRNSLVFHPLMELKWRDETVWIYLKGQVAIRTDKKTTVLQYQPDA